jgi:two-component sensor histidine kinase
MKAQVEEKIGNLYLDQKMYAKALPFFIQVKKVYESSNNAKELRDINLELSRTYEGLGNTNLAYIHLVTSNQYQDSVFNQNKIKDMLTIEGKYQAKQKEIENQKLITEKMLKDKTIIQQKYGLLAGMAGLGLLTLLSYFLYRQRNKQLQLTKEVSQNRDHIKLLNQELNHRVKNNLAFMTSLLEMQGRRTPNEETKIMLKESESRLKTLALVHSYLFKNENDSDINLKTYLQEIITHLNTLFSLTDKTLNFKTELSDHNINAEDAMRLGLIVNEMVTNSVKHAFHEVPNPEIYIQTYINGAGKLVLNYKDNGPGVAVESTSGANPDSLGVRLIELLKRQLGMGIW